MTHKINRSLVRFLPATLAHRLIVALIGKTPKAGLSGEESKAMATARPLRYGANGTAFEWGKGPLIILVHGWGGRAAQMAPLAVHLARHGFRSVALDVTGHGNTKKSLVRWHYFLRDVETLTKSLASDVHAFIGHSSGGTTLMAVRAQGKIRAQRYVCICSPSYPFLAIDSMQARFNPPESVIERHKHYLSREFAMPWNDLERGGCFDRAGSDLLLVYDKRDRLVSHSEGDRIHALCKSSKLINTDLYGHRRILTARELNSAVVGFLEPNPPSN